jgi:hypothetical protein
LKTPVRRYSLQLSEASLSVLHGLVGRAVSHVYAPCLQVDKRHLTTPSISIPTSDQTKDGWVHRYVIVRCEWFETPETRTDYWQLFVDNEDKPYGIDFSESQGMMAPCTINFYGHSSPILRVEVYKFSWPPTEQLDAENVVYDRAIRFQRHDGSSFCIACQLDGPGIATEVHVSDDEETIADLLRGSTLRVSIP